MILISSPSQAMTHLLMIGGGQRPVAAMKEFVQRAGGNHARILVSPWASQTNEGAQIISEELRAFDPEFVEVMPSFPMNDETRKTLLNHLNQATGIFFAGGDQNQLMSVINALELKEFLKNAYQSGVMLGGTSAGTAIMSKRMISGDLTPLADGLGLLPSEWIVDQHFIVRQRFHRLASVVLNHPDTYGIGIDESTSLLLLNNRIGRVIGPSQVVLFEKNSERKISVEFYQPDEQFNLFNTKNP